MKKIFITAMMALACIGANAQSNKNFTPITKLTSSPDFIPASLTSDGKGIITFTDFDEDTETPKVQLFDGDFNNYKTITATPIPIELKRYVKQRAEEITIEKYEAICSDAFDTQEAAIQYLAGNRGCAVEDIKLFKEEDGVKYFMYSNEGYWMEDFYGKKYPYRLYAYTKGQPITRCDYSYNLSCIGEWGEKVEIEDESYTDILSPFTEIWFKDYDNSGAEYDAVISQTLFNSDSKFEYLSPIYDKYESVYEQDRDGDGEIDTYSYLEHKYVSGYKIMSEDGTELARFMVEDGYRSYNEASIFIFNGRTYLSDYIYAANDEDHNGYRQIYELVAGSSGVNAVKAVGRVSVSPRVAERNQDITVSAEGTGVREVVVTNAAGKTVYKSKVAAGQSTVRINSGVLSSGLNVVSVKANDGKSENCKVIVKK